MCFTDTAQQDARACSERKLHVDSNSIPDVFYDAILPGLPDDVSKHCLALVPRSNFPIMGCVCSKWRSYIRSKEFITVRKIAGVLEEWIYVLTTDADGRDSHWEVLDCLGNKHKIFSVMPGQPKAGFGVVVLNGKLLIMAGYTVSGDARVASADVYQYDSCLDSWSKLTSMNVARYEFACAEVNGQVYAVGGYGADDMNLSSAEMYDPDLDQWVLIESLRQPRWGCFACGFRGKLYVMGGRSSFTIGNSRLVDVYDPGWHGWREEQRNGGCAMVTAHAALGERLFCIEWRDPRKLTVFNAEDGSWRAVRVPLTGSSAGLGFRFGILDGKLLLFSVEECGPGCGTLLYDPDAPSGQEWQMSRIRPSGLCLYSVTIKA